MIMSHFFILGGIEIVSAWETEGKNALSNRLGENSVVLNLN